MERKEINQIGEFGLINRLTSSFKLKNKESIMGVGDDAAVIRSTPGGLTVVSTDLMLEGIHFDLAYFPLKHLGYKSVIVNLSDIYAMNAKPGQVTVSIAVSNRFSVDALEELYKGIKAACMKYNVDLVGGDTSSSGKGLFLSITAVGSAKEENLTYRHGAKPGDIICASGDFGAAYLGLQLLEREKQIFFENPDIQPDLEDQAHIVGKFLKPEARKDIYELLDELEIKPTSMIDVSDGLSSDILHICERSKVGCKLDESRIKIHPDSFQMALNFQMDPVTCALNGGEDYELLFTIGPGDLNKFSEAHDIRAIGEIKELKDGCKILTKGGHEHELVAQGWKHL